MPWKVVRDEELDLEPVAAPSSPPRAAAAAASMVPYGFRAAPPETDIVPDTEGEPDKVGSFLRGIQQGVSFNLSDELTAAARSALGTVGLGRDVTYQQAVGEERAKLAADRAANPKATFAGNLAGGIGAGVVTGGAAAAAGLRGLPAVTGLGVAEGSLAGWGGSEAKDLAGLTRDTLTGGAIGGATAGLLQGPVGQYVSKAIQRRASQLKSAITSGTPRTNQRRFAQLFSDDPETVVEFFDRAGNKQIIRDARNTGTVDKALDAVEERLGKVASETRPKWDKLSTIAPPSLHDAKRLLVEELNAIGNEAGEDRWRQILLRELDDLDTTVGKGLPNGTNPKTVLFSGHAGESPARAFRSWVSKEIAKTDRTMGSLAETEHYIFDAKLRDVKERSIREYLDRVGQTKPAAKALIDELRPLNRDIKVLVKTQDALKPRVGDQAIERATLGSRLGKGASIATAAMLGAGGTQSLIGGALGAGVAYGSMAGARAVNLNATRALASIMMSARRGSLDRRLIEDALTAGVPLATVDAAVRHAGGALRGLMSPAEEAEPERPPPFVPPPQWQMPAPPRMSRP